jgi:hypothetical protein
VPVLIVARSSICSCKSLSLTILCHGMCIFGYSLQLQAYTTHLGSLLQRPAHAGGGLAAVLR